MSAGEAGHTGGEARKDRLDHEGYSALGKKGGQRVHDLVNEGKQAEHGDKKQTGHHRQLFHHCKRYRP